MDRAQIAQRRTQLEQLRAAAQTTVDDILNRSFGEGRAQTEEERAQIAEARSEVGRIDAELRELDELDDRLRRAEDEAAANHPGPGGQGDARGAAGEPTNEERAAAAGEARQRAVTVGREPRTYERHSDEPVSYLHDLVMLETGRGRVDPEEAAARLRRHASEMRVELPRLEARLARARGGYVDELRYEDEEAPVEIDYRSTKESRDLDRTDGSGGYFVPPVWMIEDYISLSRGGRTTADLCNRMPLPGGTDSINIPKVATGTTVAIQTADNAAVSETDLTDTSVTAGVKTIAGQQDLSLQAFEQSPIAFDRVIGADLADDHAVKTNVQVIDGSNSANQVRGILAIPSIDTTAYTDASPTLPELYPKIADSWQQIATTRFRVPEVILMHPRRWAWWESQLGTDNRPLLTIPSQGPNNSLAAIVANMAQGLVGRLPFGPVVTDPSIPTNEGGGTEDVIILGRPSEYHLWEGSIRTRVLMEVLSGTLTVRIQLYNYVAFMPHRRAESTSIVSGTGLVPPTF